MELSADKLAFLGLLAVMICLPGLLFAGDERTVPVDVYVIFDGSEAIKNSKDEAATWVCDYVVDGILREGDSLTIWSVTDTARVLFSDSIGGPDQRDSIRALLKSLVPGKGTGNYAAALEEAARREASKPRDRIAYTILISGVDTGITPAQPERNLAELLRYSRTEDFSGWKAIVVGLGIGSRVKTAASAFINSGTQR